MTEQEPKKVYTLEITCGLDSLKPGRSMLALADVRGMSIADTRLGPPLCAKRSSTTLIDNTKTICVL